MCRVGDELLPAGGYDYARMDANGIAIASGISIPKILFLRLHLCPFSPAPFD
jgi:hypothetical protein